MAGPARDTSSWMKSVERRLNVAMRASQGGAVTEMRKVIEKVRDDVDDAAKGGPKPARVVEIEYQTAVHYEPSLNQHLGEIAATFPPVVFDVNGKDIEIAWYELWGRETAPPDAYEEEPLQLMSVSGETWVRMEALPGSRWDLAVVAVSVGGKRSDFSAISEIQVLKDTTPPPVPAPLELTAKYLTVRGDWDLKSASGETMPPDFHFTEVTYGSKPAPTEVKTTLDLFNVFFVTDDTVAGFPLYVRHRAVDVSGNRSEWSPERSIVPENLVDEESLNEKFRENDEAMRKGLEDAAKALADFNERWGVESDALDKKLNTLDGIMQNFPGENIQLGTIGPDALATRTIFANEAVINEIWSNAVRARLLTANEALIGNVLIQNGAITASKMIIGAVDNMFLDPGWKEINVGANGSWRIYGATPNQVTVSTTGSGKRGVYFQRSQGTPDAQVSLEYPGSPEAWWKVLPGEKYFFSIEVYLNSAADAEIDDIRVWFPISKADGSSGNSGTGSFNRARIAGGWNTLVSEVEIPVTEGTEDLYMRTQLRVARTTASSQVIFANPQMRKKNSGELIVDGTLRGEKLAVNAITTREIAAGAVTASQIAANAVTAAKIDAGSVTASKIAANAVDTEQLRSTAINGMTITGSTIQTTTASARGVMLNNSGLRAWNAAGTMTFIVTTGGQLRAHDASIRGDITANSLYLNGELRLGTAGSSEGGIVPSGNRLRILGRVPETDTGIDMFRYHASPRFTNRAAIEDYEVVFDAPSPQGWRRIVATPTLAGGSAARDGNVALAVANASGRESRVTIRAQPLFGIGTVEFFIGLACIWA